MANDGTDGPALKAPDLVASRKGWGPLSSQTLTKTSQGWTRNRTRGEREIRDIILLPTYYWIIY